MTISNDSRVLLCLTISWLEDMLYPMRKGLIVDLFSGGGGFALSAHSAGFATPIAVDIDRDVTSSFSVNFPETELVNEDLRKIDPGSILARVGVRPGELEGVTGGPPCQGFSTMGKRNPEDDRNDLIAHFFLFVRFALPHFFVFENVPGLLNCPLGIFSSRSGRGSQQLSDCRSDRAQCRGFRSCHK